MPVLMMNSDAINSMSMNSLLDTKCRDEKCFLDLLVALKSYCKEI